MVIMIASMSRPEKTRARTEFWALGSTPLRGVVYGGSVRDCCSISLLLFWLLLMVLLLLSGSGGGGSDWELCFGALSWGRYILECVGGLWDVDVIVVMDWVGIGQFGFMASLYRAKIWERKGDEGRD